MLELQNFNSSFKRLAPTHRCPSEKAFGLSFSTKYLLQLVFFFLHEKKILFESSLYNIRVIQKRSPFVFVVFFHI